MALLFRSLLACFARFWRFGATRPHYLPRDAGFWRRTPGCCATLSPRWNGSAVAAVPQRSRPNAPDPREALTSEPLPLRLLVPALPRLLHRVVACRTLVVLCVGVLPQVVSRLGSPWRGAPLVPVPRLIYLPRLLYSLPEGGGLRLSWPARGGQPGRCDNRVDRQGSGHQIQGQRGAHEHSAGRD